MKELRGLIIHLPSKPLSSGEVGSKTKVENEESMGEDVHSFKVIPEIGRSKTDGTGK